MKSRGQHFIPRYLLKGFASRRKGDKYHAFVFRKSRAPFEANIADIGKVHYFHGNPRDRSLESKISKVEEAHAQIVRDLLDGKVDSIAPRALNEFVLHLAFRTRNIREGFRRMCDDAIKVFEERLTREEYHPKDLQTMLTVLKEELAKWGIHGIGDDLLLRLLKSTELRAQIKDLFAIAKTQIDYRSTSRETQWKWLSGEEDFGIRLQLMKHLVWKTARSPQACFILGDLGPIARFERSNVFENTHVADGRPVEAILLPVSSSCLLIGEAKRDTVIIDEEAVNRASAELSNEFFVSSKLTERERTYHLLLGHRSALIEKKKMHQLLDEG